MGFSEKRDFFFFSYSVFSRAEVCCTLFRKKSTNYMYALIVHF